MKTSYSYQVYKNYETHHNYFPIEDFKPGQYLGIRLCTKAPEWGEDGVTLYTPREVFKIVSVKEGGFSLKTLSTQHEVVLETPDHTTGTLVCTITSDRDYNLNRYTQYVWTLDDDLVSWIENDCLAKAARNTMGMVLYTSMTELKKDLQEIEKYRAEKKKEAEEERRRLEELRLKYKDLKTEPVREEEPTEKEISGLFYGEKPEQPINKESDADNDFDTVFCSFCGQRINLPRNRTGQTYFCTNCGTPVEYKK